jgi:hypothetical protein
MSSTENQTGSPYTPEEIHLRISASMEMGIFDYQARGGFSKENFFMFSFVDPAQPEGKRWIGSCLILADTIDEAMVLSRILGINPGGEVAMRGPFNPVDAINKGYLHRLMTSAEEVQKAVDPAKLNRPNQGPKKDDPSA